MKIAGERTKPITENSTKVSLNNSTQVGNESSLAGAKGSEEGDLSIIICTGIYRHWCSFNIYTLGVLDGGVWH